MMPLHSFNGMRPSRSVPLLPRTPSSSSLSSCDCVDDEYDAGISSSDEDIEQYGGNNHRAARGPLHRAPQREQALVTGQIPAGGDAEGTGSKPRLEQPTKKFGLDDASGGAIFSVSTSRLLQVVKGTLFALWLFMSGLSVLHVNVSRDGVGFNRDGEPTLLGTEIITDDGKMQYKLSSDEQPRIRVPPVPTLLRPPRNQIPLPLPPNKVSVVLMNYSRPRMIRESSLMRTLLTHPNVDEVVLLHSNPNTAFEFVHPKVVNIDATQQNDEMGLSLRFYFCQLVKNDWVIHVDDDMEFSLGTLSELLIEFGKNSRRIVGRFGRNLADKSSFNGYSSSDTHKASEVILTKLMVMERHTCSAFFEHAHLIWEDTVLNNGEGPLWNGEDIFMSLVANHVYGNHRNNFAMDWLDVWNAPDYLKDYDNGKLDISGGMSGYRFWDWHWWQSVMRRNRHYSYRGTLWKTARKRLEEEQ